MPPPVARLTPGAAIDRLKANDPTLTSVDLSNNAVLQMKPELWPQIAEALAGNNVCTDLNLSSCGMNDSAAEYLSSAIRENSTLTSLNVEANSIGNDGAIAFARALTVNRGVTVLNLMGQKGARYGDTTLEAFLTMFDTNVTLLKIIWRLESRQSFRLTKMLTRNNDIDRRIKAGKQYADLLPTLGAALPAELVAQRSLSSVVSAPAGGGGAPVNTPANVRGGAMAAPGSPSTMAVLHAWTDATADHAMQDAGMLDAPDLPPGMLRASGRFRRCWDLLGNVLMLIHLVWTARTEYWAWACHNDEVCFVESDAFVTYLRGTQELAETVVMYFCLLDILIQLRSTYHDPSGRECVDPMTCARRYVTAGSFVFDLLCALPFEAFAPLESGVAHSTEAFKISKNTVKAVTKDRKMITEWVRWASNLLGGGQELLRLVRLVLRLKLLPVFGVIGKFVKETKFIITLLRRLSRTVITLRATFAITKVRSKSIEAGEREQAALFIQARVRRNIARKLALKATSSRATSSRRSSDQPSPRTPRMPSKAKSASFGASEEESSTMNRTARASARFSAADEGAERNFRRRSLRTVVKAPLYARAFSSVSGSNFSESVEDAIVLARSASSASISVTTSFREEADPSDAPPSWSFTHEGGAGGLDKENQDTIFVAVPSADVSVFGVFDGHGKAHGQLAARAAATSVQSYCSLHVKRLKTEPEAVLREAFSAAHGAVREAFEALPFVRRVASPAADGPFLLEWVEDLEAEAEGARKWDASEGGTTATVVVVLRGRVVIAAIGDSSAVLLGRAESGIAASELMLEEHSPTRVDEFARMCSTNGKAGESLRFVYDCPGGELIDIFGADSDGTYRFSKEAEREADKHDCAVKNSRGDLMTVVIIPEGKVEVPQESVAAAGGAQKVVVEEQNIAMTRSIGDFYAHHHGVICEPEIRLLEAADLAARGWRRPHLLLASDGVWDLWSFDEVASGLLPKDDATLDAESVAAFCEATRARGHEYFDEAADNLSGILVDLSGLVAERAAVRGAGQAGD